MLNLIRSIPYLAIVGAIGFASHWFIVDRLKSEIEGLQLGLQSCITEKVSNEVAKKEQEATIKELNRRSEIMKININELAVRNQGLARERDEYVSIFRKHDLSKLAKRKPGLIEPRINKGTEEVFKQVEKDSRETRDVIEDDGFIPYLYDDLYYERM